jgi:hypothetical protein
MPTILTHMLIHVPFLTVITTAAIELVGRAEKELISSNPKAIEATQS